MTEEDKYEVLEKIGHGSFGIIRKVKRKSDGRILCRKEISYVKMSHKEKEQLQAELAILKELRHPNIVAYYEREHLKASQDLHLYMEYCGNGDLGRVIKQLKQKNQFADEEFAWSMLSQLATALYRCHYGQDAPEVGSNVMGLGNNARPLRSKQGQVMILHRDLKPENVFLGEDNSVKLGDFGLSKIMSSHDFASTYVGTPFYMSPEICAAERYTLYSDIWSLGCIMYELCTKEPPFNARTHFDLVQKIKMGKTSPLPTFYSPELRKVIESCLRVNPNSRPDTAQLLNLPIVKLMRKEQEVVSLGQQMKTEKELASRKLQEVAEKVAKLERERETMRVEMDAALRREWEVKARLEIERLVQVELESLRKTFEGEVARRVTEGISKQRSPNTLAGPIHHQNLQPAEACYQRSRTPSGESSSAPTTNASSTNTSSTATSISEKSSNSELQSWSSVSPQSNDVDPLSQRAVDPVIERIRDSRALKRNARTPLSRAKTMCVGIASPIDVQMVDPSPLSIASLNLSPRRTGAGNGSGLPAMRALGATAAKRNIFAAAAAANAAQRWQPETIDRYPSFSSDEDDDGETEAPPRLRMRGPVTASATDAETRSSDGRRDIEDSGGASADADARYHQHREVAGNDDDDDDENDDDYDDIHVPDSPLRKAARPHHQHPPPVRPAALDRFRPATTAALVTTTGMATGARRRTSLATAPATLGRLKTFPTRGPNIASLFTTGPNPDAATIITTTTNSVAAINTNAATTAKAITASAAGGSAAGGSALGAAPSTGSDALAHAAVKPRPQSSVPVVATSPARRTAGAGPRPTAGTGAGAFGRAPVCIYPDAGGSPVARRTGGLPNHAPAGIAQADASSTSSAATGRTLDCSSASSAGDGAPSGLRSKKGAMPPPAADDAGRQPTAAANANTGAVHGRTLVELSQARAAAGPDLNNQHTVELKKRAPSTQLHAALKHQLPLPQYREPVVLWDPELDEMPSPFLARGVRSLTSGVR